MDHINTNKKKAGTGYYYQIKLKSRPDTLKSANRLFLIKSHHHLCVM